MFTGIVREVGVLRSASAAGGGTRLTIEAPGASPVLVRGGSIAVDGVCLTVTDRSDTTFAADVIPETLDRTRLGGLDPGARVNLELPLRLDQPLDGHLVQGHVDGVGTVTEVRERGPERDVHIEAGPALAPFLAEKGSVAVNGVSLTVTGVDAGGFSVALIPTTLNETNLNELRPGSPVNLEVDLVARYVARLQETGSTAAAVNPSAPAEHREGTGT